MQSRETKGLEFSVASQRRRQIMNAVMASIAEEGLEKTTMRNVAQRAGVSTGTLAYYFRDKKELVDATLLDASERYMERFYSQKHPARRQTSGPAALESLVQGFLSPDNTDAAFVLQMIEVGLHNSELRGTHQEMVDAGREMIESSIRVGIDVGRYREDIDPKLAAALIHGVLIWWGSELIWNATSEELAVEASRLAVRLIEKNGSGSQDSRSHVASAIESIRSILLADPSLNYEDATTLANAFELLYRLTTKREGETTPDDSIPGNA